MMLWRVEYQIHTDDRDCRRWRSAGWWATKKKARWFIDTLMFTGFPRRIVKDLHPEKHRDWPRR